MPSCQPWIRPCSGNSIDSPAVPRGVELLAGVELDADVVHLDACRRAWPRRPRRRRCPRWSRSAGGSPPGYSMTGLVRLMRPSNTTADVVRRLAGSGRARTRRVHVAPPLADARPGRAVPHPRAALGGLRRRAGLRLPRPRRPRRRTRRAAAVDRRRRRACSPRCGCSTDPDDVARIGRVATAAVGPRPRAGRAADARTRSTWSAGATAVLEAQAHLHDWYARFGFVALGAGLRRGRHPAHAYAP